MPRRRDQELLDRVGARLQRLRTARGLTQQALAAAIGVEAETLSRAETGSAAMSLSNLALVAKALECSLADLVDQDRPLPKVEQPPEELEVLHLMRGLDAAGRAAAVDLVRVVARRWPTTA